MARNGNFSYSGGSFDVYVTSYSYVWTLETKGSSQARQRQTIYPFRAAQGDLSVTLQFTTRHELLAFAKFARGYHLAVTSVAGEVGANVPNMTFSLNLSPDDVRSYSVALPSIPVAQSNDSIAPTMRLTLKILATNDSMNYVKAISGTTSYGGSLTEAIKKDNVSASDIKSKGDRAFTGR